LPDASVACQRRSILAMLMLNITEGAAAFI
jgi:hypothetical protein